MNDSFFTGLVSVVIPTYNQKDFVVETIESVLSQTYSKIEILIADDGSTDGTVEILQKYEQKNSRLIKVLLSPMNKGIANNLNKAFKTASGEYIAWLGGDDLMLPDKIKKQVACLEDRPDAVGCCHDAEVFESETGEIYGLFSQWANGKKGLVEGGAELWFKQGYKMLPSTFMIRSSACPPDGFDERLKYTNDWLFDVEVFRNGTVAVINETLGKYRRHSKNVTGSFDLQQIAVEDNLLAVAIVEARYPELSKFIRDKRQTILLGAARRYHRSGKKQDSYQYIKAAISAGGILNVLYLFMRWCLSKTTEN